MFGYTYGICNVLYLPIGNEELAILREELDCSYEQKCMEY